MAALTDNTIVVDPETGTPVVLLAGQDVPEWAEDLIGDHLLDEVADGDYESMKVADLNAEIASRNSARDDHAKIVPAGKKKDELVAALTKDDGQAD